MGGKIHLQKLPHIPLSMLKAHWMSAVRLQGTLLPWMTCMQSHEGHTLGPHATAKLQKLLSTGFHLEISVPSGQKRCLAEAQTKDPDARKFPHGDGFLQQERSIRQISGHSSLGALQWLREQISILYGMQCNSCIADACTRIEGHLSDDRQRVKQTSPRMPLSTCAGRLQAEPCQCQKFWQGERTIVG